MKREIGGAGMAGGLSETPFYAVTSHSELGGRFQASNTLNRRASLEH